MICFLLFLHNYELGCAAVDLLESGDVCWRRPETREMQ